jgi:lipopolysaccharide/colanic/teichoic acid biosynthesis glycosyltransferase
LEVFLSRKSKLPLKVKRGVDLLMATSALVALSPLIFFLGVMVKFHMGSPIFFKQKRPGFKQHPFYIYKFRTMDSRRGSNGSLLSDAKRLTPFGKFLRQTSLDELPELLNVLKGDMSLVGPRPLLMRYLGRYNPEQARRHELKPGITGWAQIKGRNALTWEEKFKFDVWYVDHWSIGLDLKIIVKTILKVIKRSDISAHSHATMPEFMGK